MNSFKLINFNKEILINFSFAIFLLFTFFTDLRFIGPVGVSEIIFLIIFIYAFFYFIFENKFIISINNQYKLVFLTLILSLLIILINFNISLLDNKMKHLNMLHNTIAFLYLNTILFSLIVLRPNINSVIFYFYILSSVFLIFFSFIIFFFDTMIGLDLYYANTVKPSLFTKNHHQISFFSMLVLLFSFFYFFDKKNIIFLVPVIFSTLILYDTNSTGNNISFLLGLIITFVIFIFPKKFYNRINYLFIMILFFIPMLVLVYLSYSIEFIFYFNTLFFQPQFINLRLQFATYLIENITFFSFLFGHGPGGYVVSSISAPSSLREAHNTFFDLFLMAGIIPSILLIYLFLKSITITVNKKLYFITFLVLFIFFYSFTHNIIRYPFLWIVLVFIFEKNLKSESL